MSSRRDEHQAVLDGDAEQADQPDGREPLVPAMMAIYSHVPRKALEEAAKALEPETKTAVPSISEAPTTANQRMRGLRHK